MLPGNGFIIMHNSNFETGVGEAVTSRFQAVGANGSPTTSFQVGKEEGDANRVTADQNQKDQIEQPYDPGAGTPQHWWTRLTSLLRSFSPSIAPPPSLVNRATCEGMKDLPSAQEEILKASRQIDSVFMSLSKVLEKLPAASEALVLHSRKLILEATGQCDAGSVYKDTIGMLSTPLMFLDSSQSQTEALRHGIQRSVQQIAELMLLEGQLTRVVTPLTFIRRLFRIECARLDPTVQQMFTALNEDIDRLQDEIRKTFAEKFEALRETRYTLQAIDKQLRADAMTQGVQLNEKKAAVDRALHTLDAELSRYSNRKFELKDRSSKIDGHVGTLVMTIQTQDIVSQKLSHITTAIGLILQRNQSVAERGESDSNSLGELAYCQASCRLQAAHLAAVEAELAEADRQIADSTTAIREHTERVGGECVSLTELDTIAVSGDGMTDQLIETIGEVRTLVDGTVVSTRKAYEAIKPIGTLASNLTPVMLEISAQIHLIALNAMIQAAHHGAGTGLEALATETSSIARKAGDISRNVAMGVDALTKELAQQVVTFEELQSEGESKRAFMHSEARGQETALHAVRDRAIEEPQVTGNYVEEIQNLGQALGSDINLTNTVGLFTSRRTLDSLAEALGEYLRNSPTVVDPHLFDKELSAAYSMVSEHQVHRTVMGNSAKELPSDSTTLTLTIPPVRRAPLGSTTQLLQPDRTDQGLDGTRATEPQSANVTSDKTLGDNVDLF